MTTPTWDAVRPFIDFTKSPKYYLSGAFVWSTPPGGFLAVFNNGSLTVEEPGSRIMTGIFPAKDANSAQVAARVQLFVHYQDRDPVIVTTGRFYGGMLNLQEFTTTADDMRGGWNPTPHAPSEILLFGGTQSLLQMYAAAIYHDAPTNREAPPEGTDFIAWPFE
jgi:hypothetical protein